MKLFETALSVPSLRALIWKLVYQTFAKTIPYDELTIMNYGMSPIAENVKREPNKDQLSLSLYDYVVSPVELMGKVVVEVGSGRGGGASYLSRTYKPKHYIAVDQSSNAIELCKSFHKVDNLIFKVGSADQLPVDDQSADIVVNVESSHCFPSFSSFLDEVDRILRPGGSFLIADFRNQGILTSFETDLCRDNWILMGKEDINYSVLESLKIDTKRKKGLITEHFPSFLTKMASEFFCIKGSNVYKMFDSRELVYYYYHFKKKGSTK